MPGLSINEMTTYHWSFLEDVTGYQAAGVKGIGIWRRKLTEFGEERGAELLHECGLAVSSLSCAGGFTGSDGHTFRDAVDDALDALHSAVEVGASCLVVVPGARAGHTFNHARRLLCDALLELGDAAGSAGVQIALFPVHRRPVEQWSFLPSLETTLRVLERCRHPRVGMACDLSQLGREQDLMDRLGDVVPWIRMATISDPYGLSGSAATATAREDNATRAIVSALETAGYQGWYDVQLVCESCWATDYLRLIGDCRRTLTEICPRLAAAEAAVGRQVASAPAELSASAPTLDEPGRAVV